MTADLGPLQSPAGVAPGAAGEPVPFPPNRPHRPRTTGAHVLVVDPYADSARLAPDLTARGLHVTVVGSTLDGLVELGRTEPVAVVVAPEASGIAATEFVATVRAHGAAVVVAALPSADAVEAGPLVLSGAAAAVIRPYSGRSLWETLSRVPGGLDVPGTLELGPLEVDVRAYAVRVHGRRIPDLPLKEFEMLRALTCRAPDVVSNDDLRLALWGEDGRGRSDNTIAVHAARLRHRLDGVAQIRRLRGRGYSLTLALPR